MYETDKKIEILMRRYNEYAEKYGSGFALLFFT